MKTENQIIQEAYISMLSEVAEKKFVVIGNPGNSRPSALYPKTDEPQLYSEKEANDHASELNKFGSANYVHWHAKHIDDAHRYVSGSSASMSIKSLKQTDSNN